MITKQECEQGQAKCAQTENEILTEVDCYGDRLMGALLQGEVFDKVQKALDLPDSRLPYRLWVYFKQLFFGLTALCQVTDWGYTVAEHNAQYRASHLMRCVDAEVAGVQDEDAGNGPVSKSTDYRQQ